jgi:hypothetical protein
LKDFNEAGCAGREGGCTNSISGVMCGVQHDGRQGVLAVAGAVGEHLREDSALQAARVSRRHLRVQLLRVVAEVRDACRWCHTGTVKTSVAAYSAEWARPPRRSSYRRGTCSSCYTFDARVTVQHHSAIPLPAIGHLVDVRQLHSRDIASRCGAAGTA